MNGIKVSFFSDSYVLTTESTSYDSFLSLMMAAHMINISVYRDTKLLTRGAITLGDFVHRDNIAFGPGIVEAYRLQENSAKYARVIISKSLKSFLESKFNNNPLVLKSRDNFLSYNFYLLELIDSINSIENSVYTPSLESNEELSMEIYNDINSNLKKNRDIIINLLSVYKNTSIYDKYLWLINPFNHCCKYISSIYQQNDFNKFIISLDEF